MRFSRRIVGAGCVIAVAIAATPATGSAAEEGVFHKPSEQALDMGDTFSYNGKEILPEVAAEKGLSCNQEPTGTTCFDSQSEALAAGPQPAARSARKATSAKRQARASLVCSANDGRPLVLWENENEAAGWNVNMFTRMTWGNLGNPYFANASAYRMGGHSGHMAEAANGGGYWFPGPTGICNAGNLTGYSPSWNDRVSSRKRN